VCVCVCVCVFVCAYAAYVCYGMSLRRIIKLQAEEALNAEILALQRMQGQLRRQRLYQAEQAEERTTTQVARGKGKGKGKGTKGGYGGPQYPVPRQPARATPYDRREECHAEEEESHQITRVPGRAMAWEATRDRPVVQVGADMMLIPVSLFDRILAGEYGRGQGQDDEEGTTPVTPAERVDLDKKIKEGLKALRERDIKTSASKGGEADEE